jgi:RNA polymerase sigma factor (sigma-70 family)
MAEDMKQIASANDAALLAALQQGSDAALKQVYKQNYPVVVNLVISNGGSLQEAKDVFQEALIIFYERCRENSFTLSSRISTYLYSVSRNLWLKELKKKKQQEEPLRDTDDFIDLQNGESSQREEQYRAMQHALNALGEPCRSILRDFYIHSKSMEEITEQYGYTNSDNAKNQKYKCLRRLKKLFFGELKEDEEDYEQPPGN